MAKRIVVTGATSMIGVALINEYLKKGSHVLAVVRRNSSRLDRLPSSKLLKVRFLDIEEYDVLEREKANYDIFYHLAWKYTDKEHRNNPLLQQENVKATVIAAKIAKNWGCNIFIGAGSQAEYGYVKETIDETTECKPVSAYGMAKLSAYMLSKLYCEQNNIKHIWGRIFSVYGINDNKDTMINYAIDHFLKDEIAYFSSATNIWNYLFEEDCGKMLYWLGERNVTGGVYCIANQRSEILKKYIIEIEKECGKKGLCIFGDKKNSFMNLDVNIDKFTVATQYIPQIDFKIGIKKIISKKYMEIR